MATKVSKLPKIEREISPRSRKYPDEWITDGVEDGTVYRLVQADGAEDVDHTDDSGNHYDEDGNLVTVGEADPEDDNLPDFDCKVKSMRGTLFNMAKALSNERGENIKVKTRIRTEDGEHVVYVLGQLADEDETGDIDEVADNEAADTGSPDNDGETSGSFQTEPSSESAAETTGDPFAVQG